MCHHLACCCRAYDATDTIVGNPTYNCTYAWGSRAYSNYTGAACRSLARQQHSKHLGILSAHVLCMHCHMLIAPTAATTLGYGASIYTGLLPCTESWRLALYQRASTVLAHCRIPSMLLNKKCCIRHHVSLLPAGNSSYIARKASANYRTSVTRENAFGWYPNPCTTSTYYMCEMPENVWPCPATPPAPPARTPGSCEWQPGVDFICCRHFFL
jgi:hypothetical protein